MLRAPASRRPGMSLLEVLGATAIFLMSIVAISELVSAATDQAQEVRFRSRATRLCQSKLNEFAAGVEQMNGATSGEFEEEPEWTWQAEVAGESTAANLYRVKVTVSRDTPRGPVEVSMTQLIFDPQQRGQLSAGTAATDSSATDSSQSTGGSTGQSGSGGSPGGGGGSGTGSTGGRPGSGGGVGGGTGGRQTGTGTGGTGGTPGGRTGGSGGTPGGGTGGTGGGPKR